MNEAQWLAGSNVQKMLQFVCGQISDRKLRLFAIACFQHYRVLVRPDSPWTRLLEVTEQYADGLVSRDAIAEAETALGTTRHRPGYGCEDADILDHCRDGGPHYRGCWVVDSVLGKTGRV